jgi:hypothetical protein
MSLQSEILSILKMLSPSDSTMGKIRIGNNGDGGYVLPNDLEKIENVLSIGIGNEDSFDLHFAKNNIPVFQYDHTVESAVSEHELYQFNKIAWATADSSQTRTLTTMVKIHGLDKTNNSILKFDTEGAEWDCIPDLNPDILKHFRIIVCELHGLTSIGNNSHRETIRKTLENLTLNHTLVHLHANNCCGISVVEGVPLPAVVELTLLRNDRSHFKRSTSQIPGPLDFPNMTDRPDLVLHPFQ